MQQTLFYTRIVALRGGLDSGLLLKPNITKTERMTMKFRRTVDLHGITVTFYSPFEDVIADDNVIAEAFSAMLYYAARKSKAYYIWSKDYIA